MDLFAGPFSNLLATRHQLVVAGSTLLAGLLDALLDLIERLAIDCQRGATWSPWRDHPCSVRDVHVKCGCSNTLYLYQRRARETGGRTD